MRCEPGQGTVEVVGLLGLVALALVAMLAAGAALPGGQRRPARDAADRRALTPLLTSVNSRCKAHAGIKLTGLPGADHWG